MKKIIFTLIFWIILYHVYSEQVEAGSSGNKIAFTINNISNETITNANIEIISSPNWLSFSNQSLTIGSISAGASYNVEFDFSVSSAANGQGNVTFEINSDGIVWDASSNSELNIPITVNPLPDLISDFSSSTQIGSTGTTIQFYNSSSGDPTGFQWTFNGGTPSSSTDENPTVKYDNTGNYDVSLTITRNSESDTETKYSYITIEQNQFEISGKIEDFNQFTPIDYVLVEYIPNTSSQASESGSTFTNSNGDYNFTVSHGWEGTIKFSKNNYGTVVRSISSVENDRTLDQKLIFAQLECSWEYNPTAGANCIFITFASTVQFHHGEAQWNEIIGFSTITKTTTFFGSAVDNGFNVCFDDVIPGETYNNEVEVCIYDESNNLIGNCFNLSISFFYDLNTDCNHQPVNAQFQINGGKVFTKGSTVEFANTSSPQECILTSVWNFDNEHARDDCSWLQKQDCDNTCKYDEIMINTLWNGGSINDGFITEHTYNLKGKKIIYLHVASECDQNAGIMLGCDELHEWRREDEAYAGLVITDCDEFVNYSNNLTDAVVDDYNGETKYYSGSFLIEENINPQGSVYPNTEFVACNSIKLGNGFKASCDYYNNIKFQVHDNLKGGNKSSTIIQHTNLNNNLSLNNSIDIEEIKQPFAYKIYPNPANSSITIQLDGLEYFPGNIVISDINGKIVKKEIINQAESMIDISTFPSGLYFAKFIQEDRIVTKKFSKL